MTEKQLKAIPIETPEGKQELSRVAGEVLEAEVPCWHVECEYVGELVIQVCGKCSKEFAMMDGDFYEKTCTVPDPIPLTWQEAMKWRDWAVEKFGKNDFWEAMQKIYISGNSDQFSAWSISDWFIFYAQPAHYILAAVLCEIRSKGDN